MHFRNACHSLPVTFIDCKYWSLYIVSSLDLALSMCYKIKIYNCTPVSLRPASGWSFPFARGYWDREGCVILFASAVCLGKGTIQIL